MATTNGSNQQSPENHGSPSTTEQTKAGLKPVDEAGAEEDRLADEYTEDGLDEIRADLKTNPNRNLDKPDIDKPPYS